LGEKYVDGDGEKKAERQEKGFFLGRGGVIFAKIDYNNDDWTKRRRGKRT